MSGIRSGAPGHGARDDDAPPLLTLHRRYGGGDVLRHGNEAPYRSVTFADGEPHLVRDDLVGRSAGAAPARHRPITAITHITDLQLADVQSPVRFEYFNHGWQDPRFADLVPVQRPQEALTVHAVHAMIRTLNRIDAAPATGARLDLAVTTGDAIDNAQWNELRDFLALFDGGRVTSAARTRRYEGVQSVHWPDDIFWRPDGPGPQGPDLFRRDFGFPHLPGLLERARAAFDTAGLSVPWLACFGNHEALIQGVGVVTPELAEALVSGRKPVTLPEDIDLDQALETFIQAGHRFLGGYSLDLTPDPDRRPVSRREFVEAHFTGRARPDGHGFTERNRLDGTAYYVHDLPGVRLIALDTTCLAGAAEGALDRQQAVWLEERLAEVHSEFRTAGGGVVHTGAEDRLVVLFSHHGLDTLTNLRRLPGSDEALGGEDLLQVLHRYPNVVLWLNGHTHTNGVRPRPDPHSPGRGFWEVTTCAVVDWPCQTRLIELADRGEGLLSIVCTMVDHDSPAAHGSGGDLAALHRELAGNVPWAGFESRLNGTAADRNVELLLRAPFPLARLR